MLTRSDSHHSRRILLATILTIVIVLLCSLFVSMQSTKLLSQAEHEAFLTTSAFSQLVANWLVSERDRQHERVLSAAEAMLLGDHVYINVAYHGDTIVNARASGWDDEFLPSSAITNSMIQRTDVSLTTIDGMKMIDAVVPLPGVEGIGNLVRVRIHASSLESQIHNARLAAALAGFLCWLVVFGIVLFAKRKAGPAARKSSSEIASVDTPHCIICGRLQIHTKRKTISIDGRHVSYPPKLFHLLELLALEQDKAFSPDEILEHVWSDATYANANDVRQCVYRLRRKLNDLQDGLGGCITNVKGFGYRFDATQLSEHASFVAPLVPSATQSYDDS